MKFLKWFLIVVLGASLALSVVTKGFTDSSRFDKLLPNSSQEESIESEESIIDSSSVSITSSESLQD